MDDTFFPSIGDDELRQGAKLGIRLQDFVLDDPSTREGYRGVNESDKSTKWGDTAKALGSGALTLGSSLANAADWATGGLMPDIGVSDVLDAGSDALYKSMSVQKRREAEASLFGQGEGYGDVGIGGAIGTKLTMAAPSLVASLVPAGLAVRFLNVGPAGAAGIAKGVSAAMTAGEVAQNIFQEVERADHDTLMHSDVYAGYISMGMTPEEAKDKYKHDVAGAMPLLAGAVSYLSGGVEGQIGARLGGEAAKGFLKGAGKGALLEAVQEMGESGGGTMLSEAAGAAYGLSDMDWMKVLNDTAEGGLIGGAMGGAAGGAANIGGRSSVERVPDARSPDAAQTAALNSSLPQAAPAAATATPSASAAPTSPAATPINATASAATSATEEEEPGLTLEVDEEEAGPGQRLPDIPLENQQLSRSGRPLPNRADIADIYDDEQYVPDGYTPPNSVEQLRETMSRIGNRPQPFVDEWESLKPEPAGQAREDVPFPDTVEQTSDSPFPVEWGNDPLAGEDTASGPTPPNSVQQLRDTMRGINARSITDPYESLQKIPSVRGRQQVEEDIPFDMGPDVGNVDPFETPAAPAAPEPARVAPAEAPAAPAPAQPATPAKPPKLAALLSKQKAQEQVRPDPHPELEEDEDEDVAVPAPTPEVRPQPTGNVLRPLAQVEAERKAAFAEEAARKAAFTKKEADVRRGQRGANKFGTANQGPSETIKVKRDVRSLKARTALILEQYPPNTMENTTGTRARAMFTSRMNDIVYAAREEGALRLGRGDNAFVDAAEDLVRQVDEKGIESLTDEQIASLKKMEQEAFAKAKSAGKKTIDELRAAQKADAARKVEGMGSGGTSGKKAIDEAGGNTRVNASARARNAVGGLMTGTGVTVAERQVGDKRLRFIAERDDEGNAIVAPVRKVELTEEQKRKAAEALERVQREEEQRQRTRSELGMTATAQVSPQPKPEPKAEPKPKSQDLFSVSGEAAPRVSRVERAGEAFKSEEGGELATWYKGLPKDEQQLLRRRFDGDKRYEVGRATDPADARLAYDKVLTQYRRVTKFLDSLDPVSRQFLHEMFVSDPDYRLDAIKDLTGARRVYEQALVEHADTLAELITQQVEETKAEADAKAAEQLARKAAERAAAMAAEDSVRGYGPAKAPVVVKQRRVPPRNATMASSEMLQGSSETPIDANTGEVRNAKTGFSTLAPRYTLGDVLPRNFNHLSGVQQVFANFLRNRVFRGLEKTPVYIVSHEEMVGLSEGYFAEPASAFYDHHGDYIAIDESRLGNPETDVYLLLHEGVHGAFDAAVHNDPYAQAVVDLMMRDYKSFFPNHVYAMDNRFEFIAEAFTNTSFQERLAMIPASAELKALLRAEPRKNTMWDVFVALVRQTLGIQRGFESLLDSAMRAGQYLAAEAPAWRSDRQNARMNGRAALLGSALTDQVNERVRGAVQVSRGLGVNVGGRLRKGILRVMTNDQLRQAAETSHTEFGQHYFRVIDAIEKMGPLGRKYAEEGHALAERMRKLAGKDSAAAQELGALAYDATMADVHPDHKITDQVHRYLLTSKGKIRPRYVQAIERHKDLRKRYLAMSTEARDLFGDMKRYFQESQNAVAEANVRGVLEVAGDTITLPAGKTKADLARWVLDGGIEGPEDDPVNAAMRTALGKRLTNQLASITSLKRINGAYFPLMRRGNYVLRMRERVDPKGGTYDAEEGTLTFKDSKEAFDYARQSPLLVTNITRIKDDAKKTIGWTVHLQTQHVEMFETEAEARAALKEAVESGEYEDIKGVENRADSHVDLSMAPRQVQLLIKSIQQREGLDDAQRKVLEDSIIQTSIMLLRGTRVQQRRLPRRRVQGASTDLMHNTIDYATSVGNYRAKQELSNEVNAGMADLRKVKEQLSGQQHDTTMVRDDLFRELEQRVRSNDTPEESGPVSKAVRTLLALSFLDKLASPAYSLINAMQPWLITQPVLSAKYGWGRAMMELTRAYGDIGGLGTVRAGLSDTIDLALLRGDKGTDFLASYKDRLLRRYPGSTGQELAELLDYLAERGAIDPNAGMEIARWVDVKTAAGRGLNRAELVARALPTAIEAINRATTALAAYRLARGSMDHAEAMKEALTQVNNTQGNYSATNTAPLFNHPTLRLMLQFKKYGQMVYYLLGKSVYQAFKGTSPQEKREAVKTLLNIAAMHVAIGGAMGLPLEPLKFLFVGIGLLGGPSWEDVEDELRQYAAKVIGARGAEAAMKGLPRLAGIDLSSRVGLDSLLSFGGPRESTERDTKVWLLDTIAGAPFSLVTDWAKGVGDITQGNLVKGAERLIPLKVVSDSIKAYREGTEGQTTKAGRQTMEPSNFAEMGARAFGLTPRDVAAKFERDRVFYDTQKRQSTNRQDMMGSWLNASKAERGRAWDRIREWNKGRPEDQRITMEALRKTEKRRQTEVETKKIREGYRVGKADEPAYQRAEIYR